MLSQQINYVPAQWWRRRQMTISFIASAHECVMWFCRPPMQYDCWSNELFYSLGARKWRKEKTHKFNMQTNFHGILHNDDYFMCAVIRSFWRNNLEQLQRECSKTNCARMHRYVCMWMVHKGREECLRIIVYRSDGTMVRQCRLLLTYTLTAVQPVSRSILVYADFALVSDHVHDADTDVLNNCSILCDRLNCLLNPYLSRARTRK